MLRAPAQIPLAFGGLGRLPRPQPMSMRFRREPTLAGLSCIALGSLLLPWFNDWVPFSLSSPMFFVVPASPLATWVGWVVASLDALVLLMIVHGRSQRALCAQTLLATGAVVVLCVGGVWWTTMPRTDLVMRIQAIGSSSLDRSWMRCEFAIPLVANLGMLILGWGRRRFAP